MDDNNINCIEIIDWQSLELQNTHVNTGCECIIEICNQDMAEGYFELQNKGLRPVLHNMCNSNMRGGYASVDTAIIGAQEEDLIRRSDYMNYLKEIKYPLPEFSAIYTSSVCFTKKGLREKYDLYEDNKKRFVDIIACSAVQNNNMGIHLSKRDAMIMECKIEHIFYIANKYNHDAVVLSAFGCGGFRCPPEHVSKIFKKVIKRWSDKFKCIRFCIFDENYVKSNYQVFKDTLGGT